MVISNKKDGDNLSKRTTVTINSDVIAAKVRAKGWKTSYFCVEIMGKYRTWMSEWKRDNNLPSPEEAAQMCAILQVEPEEILPVPEDVEKVRALINEQKNNAPGITEDVVSFDVIGEVAAGYGRIANDAWIVDRVDVPRQYLHGRAPSDYFVLRVCGDSMYPLYMEGDIVLVLRQTTLNRSGEIGVVMYDDDNATLKKVEYVMGEDWMKLIPINPQFQPVTITGEDLEHCRVLGVPKVLIRNLSE